MPFVASGNGIEFENTAQLCDCFKMQVRVVLIDSRSFSSWKLVRYPELASEIDSCARNCGFASIGERAFCIEARQIFRYWAQEMCSISRLLVIHGRK